MSTINYDTYNYADLVQIAKRLGINAQNLKKEEVIKLIQQREQDQENTESNQVAQAQPATQHAISRSRLKENIATDETFETTEKVRFIVNGQVFEGTEFTFSREVVDARKTLLRESYGKDIIVE